jgi:oligoribonuclease NrnB/cAMP/cGMP phosphodiesterase (DHH superfamily)
LPADLKKKFEIILSREQISAKYVALKALTPKPLSVWEVLIPILFILSFMKSKQDREVFAQNLLFTKKLALEAALDMIEKNKSRESVMDQIKSKTDQLISTLPDNLYSNAIRQEQVKEIDLLIDHYCKLIQAEGNDYDALVLSAYGNQEQYKAFHARLKDAEKKVAQAARQTLGVNTDSAMAARIEEAMNKQRMAEVEKIFGPQGKQQNA